MSLAMMIGQPDAAHLITDGGWWDEDGICTAIGSKVATFPALNAAIVCTGFNGNPHRFLVAVDEQGIRSTGDLLRSLSDTVRQMVADDAAICADPRLTVHVIAYDPIPGPACWIVSSGGSNMPPGYEPFTLQRARGIIDFADPSTVLGRPVDITDPTSFDVAVDGLALARAARLEPWPRADGSPDRYHVAGFTEITSVSAAGLTRRTLCEWPMDRIGVPTMPLAPMKRRGLNRWRN